jgi:DNA-binding NarL/FixJ family response regulator
MLTTEEVLLTPEEIREYFKKHPAEQKVLQLLCNERSPKQIADERNTDITTVRTQIASIHRVLDRHDNASAIIRGLKLKVITLPEGDE